MTLRRALLPVLICLVAATAASAQPGGGGRGRGGGGPPPAAKKPAGPPEFIGVVQKIDTATGRVTIAYEPLEVLNWPAGTQPFPVAKSAMLEGVTVGEKVRFTLDSGSIATLKSFDAPADPPRR